MMPGHAHVGDRQNTKQEKLKSSLEKHELFLEGGVSKQDKLGVCGGLRSSNS